MNQHDPEVYIKFFKHIVSTSSILTPSSENKLLSAPNFTESHQTNSAYLLLKEEVQTLSSDPTTSYRFALSVAPQLEQDLITNFDLSTFLTCFDLNSLQKTILCLAIKNNSISDFYQDQGVFF